jgi:hypothetical protein
VDVDTKPDKRRKRMGEGIAIGVAIGAALGQQWERETEEETGDTDEKDAADEG